MLGRQFQNGDNYISVSVLIWTAAAAAKSLQLCPTLCDPRDGSPPGSTVPGILQARTLEWVAFPSPMHESEKWKWSCSVVSDLSTWWTIAYQALLSMGFSRQEYWSGVPLPSPKWMLCFIKSKIPSIVRGTIITTKEEKCSS